jgi:hypothetical protein
VIYELQDSLEKRYGSTLRNLPIVRILPFEILLTRYCETRLSARKAAVGAASDDCAEVNTNLSNLICFSVLFFWILDHIREKNIHMT